MGVFDKVSLLKRKWVAPPERSERELIWELGRKRKREDKPKRANWKFEEARLACPRHPAR